MNMIKRTNFSIWMVILMLILPLAFAQTVTAEECTNRFIEKLDQNDDGAISIDEFPGPDEHFGLLDKDQNGTIDSSEIPLFGKRGRRGRMGGGFFAHWDTDNDGVVTKDEFSGTQDHFTRLDQNEDGYIDEKETSALGSRWGKRIGDRMMNRLDKDGDGSISMDEFPGPEDHFTRLDQNSDGTIDESETPGRGLRHGKLGKRLIQKFDTDEDGLVSKEEFEVGHANRFARMDLDGNGQIDQDEMPRHRMGHRFGGWEGKSDNAPRRGPGMMHRSWQTVK